MISPQEQLQIVIEKIKSGLKSKGANAIRRLGKTFRGFDSFDKSHKLDKDEFYIGLKENGVQLTKQQSDLLLNYLDHSRDGTIDVQEFLTLIRVSESGYYSKPSSNKARQDVILEAFNKFDIDRVGYLLKEDLRGVYNARDHPKVRRAELTEDQAFIDFLENFKEGNTNGRITLEEWKEYYDAVSADIQDDQNFVVIMRSTWRL